MTPTLSYQLVYAPRRQAVASLPLNVVAVVLLVGIFGVKIWIKTQITETGYELSRSRDQMIAYDMKRRELELQRSVLLRPDAIAREAHQRLGLTTLRPSQARRVTY